MLLVAGMFGGCASSPRWIRQTYAFSQPPVPPAIPANTNRVVLRRVSISPLFQSRSFTYRTAENTYIRDPYAGFLIAPEEALGESIRAWMRAGNAFGTFVEPGSDLIPTLAVEVSINEIYGDFRAASQPVGTMALHFILYEVNEGTPGRILLDKGCAHTMPLARKTPEALMVAWNTDLHCILEEIGSAYIQACSNSP